MLNEKALTVNLKISCWTARKYDQAVSKEVEQQHEAQGDAGRYNKLLVDKGSIREIQQVVNKMRTFHHTNTLPWGDNGDRLLPSENYFAYIAEVNKLKGEFDKAVQKFVMNYPDLVNRAASRLGTMFRESDYPSAREIGDKFGVKPTILPVAEMDFRVNLSDNEIEQLKSAAQIEIQERLNTAVKDSWRRIKEQLVHMKERLTEQIERTDKEGNKYITDGILRDSLFKNLESLVDLLPRLNITNDPNITAICDEMRELVAIDPEDVRNSQTVRANTAQQVDDIMSKFSSFF
jgi:hypothetical protein